MMKQLLIILSLLVLFSCSKKKTYYILTTEAWHITTETKLFHRGVAVGQVDDISFYKNKVRLECSLEKYALKSTDQVVLSSPDLFTKVIEILPGKGGKSLPDGDTIVRNLSATPILQDPKLLKIRNRIEEKLDELIQNDSIKRQ